jgi:mono/diheme cytochrome c family protein
MHRTYPTRRLLSGLLIALFASALPALAQTPGPIDGKRNPLAGMREVTASKGLMVPPAPEGDERAARGRYLVGLLGCASCHTNGALIGEPDMSKPMAGSRIGIAYTNPMSGIHPGVVYPGNLTPDPETGLGKWSEEDIVAMLRSGRLRHGRQSRPIMPWISYAQLTDEDAGAIARYLKTLPAVEYRVPESVPQGTKADTPLVHVGLYRSN